MHKWRLGGVRSSVRCNALVTAPSHHRRSTVNLFWNFCFYFHFPIFSGTYTSGFFIRLWRFYVDSFMLVVYSAARETDENRIRGSSWRVKSWFTFGLFAALEAWIKIRVKLIKSNMRSLGLQGISQIEQVNMRRAVANWVVVFSIAVVYWICWQTVRDKILVFWAFVKTSRKFIVTGDYQTSYQCEKRVNVVCIKSESISLCWSSWERNGRRETKCAKPSSLIRSGGSSCERRKSSPLGTSISSTTWTSLEAMMENRSVTRWANTWIEITIITGGLERRRVFVSFNSSNFRWSHSDAKLDM